MRNITKRAPMAVAVFLAVVFVVLLGFTAYSSVVYADDIATPIGSLTVGHLSDIHYFPLEYCYQDMADVEKYKNSDFYHEITGDTKLVLESGMTFNAVVRNIIADAQNGVAPTYFVASGDLCKNGERVALIDVANMLRYLQNEVRAVGGKYANFQVFAMVGNHDLYNQDGELYSQNGGEGRIADALSAMQFAMIFAGLGFPNASLDGEDGSFNLTTYINDEDYWASDYTSDGTTGYVFSKNAENLKITYRSPALQSVVSANSDTEKLECYLSMDDELGYLSYVAELTDSDKQGYTFAVLDASDRIPADKTIVPSRIGETEYAALKTSSPDTKYYGVQDGKDDTFIDLAHELTDDQIQAAFASGKAVFRALPYQHITGGRLTTACIDWTEETLKTLTPDATIAEETIISVFHHNVLPHFEQEDDILKDFTLYNWEYAANRFLGMGVRYALTGHMHSSDAMTYTDVEGRTLYDFETGSIISYASPRRYIDFNRLNCGGKLGEEVISRVYQLDALTYKASPSDTHVTPYASNHIAAGSVWDQSAFDAQYAIYQGAETEANWTALVATNPDFLTYIIQYKLLSTLNYNEYISGDIYTVVIDRMIHHFLTRSTVDGLISSLYNLIDGLGNSQGGRMVLDMLGVNASTLHKAAKYLIDTVLDNLYGASGYPYNGQTYTDAIEYVKAIVNNILDMEYGDETITCTSNPTNAGKMNVREIASFILMAHSAGTELTEGETYASIDANYTDVVLNGRGEYCFMQPYDRTYRKRMLAAVKDLHSQLLSGKFVDDLLSGLLDPLFNNEDSLLKTLLNKEFDFSEAGMTVTEYDYLAGMLQEKIPEILRLGDALGGLLGVSGDFSITIDPIDPEAFCLGELINELLPLIKPLVGNLIGFNLDGDDIISILQNALDGYVTPSFCVGLGGIADAIIMAYGYDVYPDLADNTDSSLPYTLQPNANYKYGETKLAYLSTLNTVSTVGATFNSATQLNGRVPSRLTANFDTKDSQTKYTIKFYTAENVYATFKYKTAENGEWISVSTSKANANMSLPYIDSKTESTQSGIKVKMVTQTKPAYVPLIDLGLLCLTHGEIVDKDKNPYVYGDRDKAAKNSVIYWNVTTVEISGLKAGTTYYYDVEGNYALEDGTAQFSYVAYNKLNGYGKDYYTFTTAADESVTSFSFLTIADIQGMIQSMYDDSYKAVTALLADERTKDFDFILNAGDMCDNGKNFNQWSMALDTYSTLFSNYAQFMAAGNHENGSNAMATYFNYTLARNSKGYQVQTDVTDGIFYSFNYGNAHFTVLNTNDADANGLGAKQLDWLKDDLKNTTAKWKFVLMHKSLYSGGSHSRDAEVVKMREQLTPLFKQYGVSIVFAGHDHTYTTTYMLDANGNIVDQSGADEIKYTGDGVLFITLGTMGTKYYTYGENENVTPKFDEDKSILHTLDTQTFGKVVVDGDTITYTGYRYNASENKLEVIGESKLTSINPHKAGLSKVAIIAISVVIPTVVVAGALTAVLLVLKKKGKLTK